MKRSGILLLIFVLLSTAIQAQSNIGIGTDAPNPNAILDLSATDKGILIPRLTTAERMSISTALSETGLLVFDQDENIFYYWNSAQWTAFPKDLSNTNEIQNLTFDSLTNELSLSGANTVKLNIFDANQNSGPKFIPPVVLSSGIGPTTITVDASSHVPANARSIILEAEGALDGPEGGDTDAHIKVRADSTHSAYVLLRARARGEDDGSAWAGQGTFPLSPTQHFDLLIESPGFDMGWEVRLIGYY